MSCAQTTCLPPWPGPCCWRDPRAVRDALAFPYLQLREEGFQVGWTDLVHTAPLRRGSTIAANLRRGRDRRASLHAALESGASIPTPGHWITAYTLAVRGSALRQYLRVMVAGEDAYDLLGRINRTWSSVSGDDGAVATTQVLSTEVMVTTAAAHLAGGMPDTLDTAEGRAHGPWLPPRSLDPLDPRYVALRHGFARRLHGERIFDSSDRHRKSSTEGTDHVSAVPA